MTEQEQSKLDKLIRVIRALKAKAEGTNNENEAAAFTAKAAEMMAQYGLEEAQLAVEEQSPIEEVTEKQDWSSPSRRALAVAVCRLYMVRPLLANQKGHWILIGRKHNIMMAKEMCDYLVKTTLRLSNTWRKENFASNAQMIDFRKGCFIRLGERIGELRRQQEQAEAPKFHPGGNPANLPALRGQEKDLLDEYLKRTRPHLRYARRSTIRTGAAASAGYAAGGTVSLSRQVGGKSSSHLIGHRR
jgi:Protein of unknown function (DUF2786)